MPANVFPSHWMLLTHLMRLGLGLGLGLGLSLSLIDTQMIHVTRMWSPILSRALTI